MAYKNPVCKGDWLLGTACGMCERCIESAPEAIARLRQHWSDAKEETRRVRDLLQQASDERQLWFAEAESTKIQLGAAQCEIEKLTQCFDEFYEAIGIETKGEDWFDYVSQVKAKIGLLNLKQEPARGEAAMSDNNTTPAESQSMTPDELRDACDDAFAEFLNLYSSLCRKYPKELVIAGMTSALGISATMAGLKRDKLTKLVGVLNQHFSQAG